MKTRGKITAIAIVESPIRHGGETIGNVQQFRRRPVWRDGERWEVPYVSGNSVKHFVRENAVRFALDAIGIDDGLTKADVQLLFAGGTLSKGGSSVRLDVAQRVLPVLSLCGYAAGNVTTESKVRVDLWDLACWETAQLYTGAVEKHRRVLDMFEDPAEDFLATDFGTNHEPLRRSDMRELLSESERTDYERMIGSKFAEGDKRKGDSSQMYYEYEVLVSGAVLVGGFSFPYGVSVDELAAFRSAFVYAAEGRADDGGILVRWGGASATGFGRVSLHLHGLLCEGIQPLRHVPTSEFSPPREEGQPYDEALLRYIDHLEQNRAGIRESLDAILG